MENRLDKFFKNKLEEKSFPFDESHWEEMAAELDKREEKNRPFFFWWNIGLSSILLIGGFVAFFFFNPPEVNSGQVIGKYANEEAPIEIAETQPIVVTQEESTSAASVEDLNHANSVVEEPNSQPIASETETAEIPVIQKSKTQKAPKEAIVQTDRYVTSKDIFRKEKINTTVEVKETPKAQSITEIAATNEIVNSNEETITVEKETIIEETGREELALLALLAPPTPSLLDEESAQFKAPIIPIRKFRNAGFVFGLSATGVAANQREGIGLSAGLFADYYFNKTLSIGFNPNFKRLTGTFGRDGLTEQVTYGFGRTTQEQTLTPKAINLLEAPLSLGLNFKRNRIQLGVGFSYLLAVQAEKITTEESDFTALSRLSSERGVIEEPMTIPQMSYFATAGYERQWSRFSLGFSANYYQENYFQEEEPKENLITLEAKLKMNLFK